MQFTVRDWMMDLVVFVDPEATVAEALAMMRRRYIQSLIVKKTAENPEYGIITSRDISDKIVAQDRNPRDLKVKDIMSSPIITVPEDMSLKECALIMKKHRIHHLPVINKDGEITGMIAAADFLVAAEAMSKEPGEHLS